MSDSGTLPTVLVVDDIEDNLHVLGGMLRELYRLEYARGGLEALEMAARLQPDLMLLDLMMPDLDGFGVLARLAADPRTATIPVIVVTARNDSTSEWQALRAGAVDFICKPVNVHIVRARVGLHIGAKLREIELRRLNEELESRVAERTQQLSDALAAATAASRAKSAFLANMSHEIRTPINAMTGMSYLIRRSGVTPEQATRLDKIDTAARHLLSILNAVLDLAKIDAGKFELAAERFTVGRLVEDIAAITQGIAESKGVSFEAVNEAGDAPFIGDPARLQQAIINFCGNAVKFTPSGGRVILRARIESADAGSALLRFEVEDSGIGIEPEAIERLFHPFEQVDNSTTRTFGGTGLGLSITRTLAEMMGGRAGASSTPGAGSTFWLTARVVPAAMD